MLTQPILAHGRGDCFTVRTALSCNFNCESGKERLAKLGNLQTREPQAAQFVTATEDAFSQAWDNGDECGGHRHRKYRRNGLMRLGASINLDSRITASLSSLLLLPYGQDCMFVTISNLLTRFTAWLCQCSVVCHGAEPRGG